MGDGFSIPASGLPSIKKDPQAILDYEENWAAWLTAAGADTIVSATWTVPDGLTIDDQTHTATTTTVWLAGGVAHTKYTVTCHIVTAGGRVDDRSFVVVCEQR